MAALPEEQLSFHHCFHFPVFCWLKACCPLLPSPGKKPTDFQPRQPAPLFCLRDFLPFPMLASLFVQSHAQDVGSQQCNVHLCTPVFLTQWNPEPTLSKCFKCKAIGTFIVLVSVFFFFFLQHLKMYCTLPRRSCCFSKRFLKEDSLKAREWAMATSCF